jgi:DNA-binding winged helix-turn-helix (wHTH) protein/tetratricopeptide (TPR) repeat protein
VTRRSEDNRQRYRFAQFLLDCAARELRRGDDLLVLSPKVFDCITYLVENRERAVGRDELIAAIWGRTNVSDIQLGQLVRKVRRLVGDSADCQAMVRTVPRFGFRWVAQVDTESTPRIEPVPSSASTQAAGIAIHADTSRRRFIAFIANRYVAVASFIAIALALTGLAYWRLVLPDAGTKSGSAETAGARASADSVVDAIVLPVGVPSDDPDATWMRLGLMDQIGARIRNAGLIVVPSDNVIALARHTDSVDSIVGSSAEATGARYVVVPTAVHSDGGWLLRAELRGLDSWQRDFQAQAANPISAARVLADQIVIALGREPLMTSVEPVEWLQRIDAALLADDFSGARRLIESAPEPMRGSQELRFSQARLDLVSGNLKAAADTLTQLLAMTPEDTTPVLRANFERVLGVTRVRLGEIAAGEEALTRAISALENLTDPMLLGAAYIDRSGARLLGGKNDEAAADLSRARVVLEPSGDALALAGIDFNEGALHSLRAHYAESLPLFERAELTFRKFSADRQLNSALGNEIDANLQLLKPRAAMSAADRGYEQNAPQFLVADSAFAFQRVRALMGNGRISEARNLINTLADQKDAKRHAMLAALESELDLNAGNATRALQLASAGMAALPDLEFASVRASTSLVAIRALHALGRNADAAGEVAKLAKFAQEASVDDVRIHARLAEAEQAWSERRAEAVALYEQALRDASAQGVPANVAEVAVSYGNALVDGGELSSAASVVGQVARWADRDFDCALLQARLFRALGEREPWHAALDRARSLAGERPIPADVISPPKDALMSSAVP